MQSLRRFREVIFLVLGVYYKLQTFIYLTANGIVQGIRPLVGYNYGAREYDRVKKIAHTSMGLIALVMVMGMAISCAIPQQLMGLFTTSRATMEIGGAALRIISFGFVVSSVSVTFPESWRDWERACHHF